MESAVLVKMSDYLKVFENTPSPESDEEYGENVLRVRLHEAGEGNTRACISFLDESVVTPTLLRRTEENVHRTSEGEDVVADDEVLKVKNVAGAAEGVESREHVKSESTGKGKYDNCRQIDKA